jgi:hypothetical protein
VSEGNKTEGYSITSHDEVLSFANADQRGRELGLARFAQAQPSYSPENSGAAAAIWNQNRSFHL